MWLWSSIRPGNTVPPVSSGVTPENPSGVGSPRLVIAAIAASEIQIAPSITIVDFGSIVTIRPASAHLGLPAGSIGPALVGTRLPYTGGHYEVSFSRASPGRTGRSAVVAMTHLYDPGPVGEPYASLVGAYPGAETYPSAAFRVEWGPIFHRGRLDGSARLLVIGQDPAQSETVVRRILVGEAGHRTQGLMAKLGFTRSYLLINTFLYSVYGQTGGEQHKDDQAIVDYRNSWLRSIFGGNEIDAVLALGALADDAWHKWKQTPVGQNYSPAYARVPHPTEPESSSGGDPIKLKAAITAMLQNWNEALAALHPLIKHPDVPGPLVPYGDSFAPEDRIEIPEFDAPAGLPEWMRSPAAWAQRVGKTAAEKRANITITVPV